MDISGRMRANNIVVSLVLALYFMLQTVGRSRFNEAWKFF